MMEAETLCWFISAKEIVTNSPKQAPLIGPSLPFVTAALSHSLHHQVSSEAPQV